MTATVTVTIPPLSTKQKKLLLELFADFNSNTGYAKLVMMSQIRDIVFKVDIRSMLDFIESIDDPYYLKILLGCGMRGTLWQAVTKRNAELAGV